MTVRIVVLDAHTLNPGDLSWSALEAQHPDLEAYSTSISCAVNEEYARMHAVLADGDEVAFLPPVSGG